MPRPDLGRTTLNVRLDPGTRQILGPHPSERARTVLERWAFRRRLITRPEIAALSREAQRLGDGDAVNVLESALNSDEGSAAWWAAVELVLESQGRE